MKMIHLVSFGSLIIFGGCRSARTVATVENQNEPVTMIGTTSQPITNTVNYAENELQPNTSNTLDKNDAASIAPIANPNQSSFSITTVDNDEKMEALESSQSKNIQSFAQVKAMAASGNLKLSNKQLKRLDKLDSKYHGDFNHLKNDFGEFSQTAKIIAAVGIIGLLLAILTGSFFGAFLAILAAGAFLCRWIGIFEF